MYSIRNPIAATAILSLALAITSGCKENYAKRYVQKSAINAPADPVNPVEIPVDGAIEKRNWPVVVATYQSGRTVAGPTLFRYSVRPDLKRQWQYYFLDPLVFVGNVVTVPYAAYKTCPWNEEVSNGVSVPPSYTAVGPLPPALDAEPAPLSAEVLVLPATTSTATSAPFIQPSTQLVRPSTRPTTKPTTRQ